MALRHLSLRFECKIQINQIKIKIKCKIQIKMALRHLSLRGRRLHPASGAGRRLDLGLGWRDVNAGSFLGRHRQKWNDLTLPWTRSL